MHGLTCDMAAQQGTSQLDKPDRQGRVQKGKTGGAKQGKYMQVVGIHTGHGCTGLLLEVQAWLIAACVYQASPLELQKDPKARPCPNTVPPQL
jgi:hypothetical protein